MKAIVTGGHGFLGSYVVDELTRRGWDVAAPTASSFDLRKRRDVEAMFWAFKNVNAVVHCAAKVGGIGANIEAPADFFRDNVMMGVNLMDEAKHAGVEKFLTIGTACMYPEFMALPQRELDLYKGKPAAATAPYAFAKRAILEMGQAYRDQYQFSASMVIPTNLYGPGDNFDPVHGHVIPAMIQKFFDAQDEVVLWGTGTPSRDFLYVEDAAKGVADALEKYDGPEPINLGSGAFYSIGQLAQHIATICGFTGRIVWDTSKPDGAPYRYLSTEWAEKYLGWKATTPLNEGLEKTVAWYQEFRG